MNDQHQSEPEPLRLLVDLNRCQGYAQCCFLAPQVFQLHGEEALLYHPNPDGGERDAVLRAAASCPVQAIVVQVPGTPVDKQLPRREIVR